MVYRDIVVSRLREVLTPDEVASGSRPEDREKQIAHHELVAPVQDVYSVVDLASANNLVGAFARRLLPPATGRAAQEALETELKRYLKKIGLWRDPIGHPTESNRPKQEDAIALIEAAQHALDLLGLDSHALTRFIAGIRGSDRAARKALASEASYTLPARMTLYGRDRDLEDLCALLSASDSNLVTVTGPGGSGKTSTAVEAIRSVASHQPRRVRFIRLETVTTEEQVLIRIGEALGQAEQRGYEGLLITDLRAKPAILLLDNLEQALSASELIGRLAMGCEQSLFVATSRERLGIKHERVFSLPTLAVPAPDDSIGDIRVNPSVQMFIRRLEAGRGKLPISDAEYRDVAAIVRGLDGLCLAIELIAAQSVDRNIANVKRQIPRLLAQPVVDPTMPERHQTLIACLKSSWDLATKNEQALLKRIVHVFGEFSEATLDSMCLDLSFKSTDDVAAAAIRRNLLRKSHDGYSLLEPVRQFVLTQVSSHELRHALAALQSLAIRLADSLPEEDRPFLEDLIEVFEIGSNALVLLENFHLMVDRDQALLFLLSWCPLSWRFDPTFGRWDDELVALLTLFARRRRDQPSQLVGRGLVELARLHNHYERMNASRDSAVAALLEALALDDAALARSAIAVFLMATVGNQPARQRLMARLTRRPRNEALVATMWALAIPGQFAEIPDGAFSGPLLQPLGGDGETARDTVLAVKALQTIAAGHIAAGDREAATNALFHSQLILDSYGWGERRLWREQAELAERSRDPFTLHQALIGSACDLLGLSDDFWDAAIFEVTGRRNNLPVVESTAGVPREFHIRWPRGRRENELRQLLERGNSTTVTIESSALLAALSIRSHDHDTFDRCVGHMTRIAPTNHSDALVVTAFAIWAARDGNTLASTRILAQLVPWLASRSNPMAAFSLRSYLAEVGVTFPRRRWRLDASEKAAALNAVRGMTLERLAEFAEAEIIRIKRRDEAKRLQQFRRPS